MKESNLILSLIGLVITLSVSQPIFAGQSVSVVCGNGKTIELDRSKNSPAAQASLCLKAGHPAPLKKSTAGRASGAGALAPKAAGGEKQGLLLPAVQAAREAAVQSPRQPAHVNTGKQNLSSGATRQTADTSCNGVDSCNDMIATCIALGGNVTPTSYDPGSGSPDGATCFNP